MVKKIHIVVPMSLVLLSGCSWRSKKQPVPHEAAAEIDLNTDEQRISIFDVHEQAFVLEDTTNPFSPTGGIPLEESEPLWVEDKAEQFETVYFGFNQYTITPEQRITLQRTTEALRNALSGEKVIIIEGHACNSAGSPRYNTMLSEKRAQEVRNSLAKAGIPTDKMRVVGRGSEMRKIPTGNREQQAPNRRVEFYIVEQTKTDL